MFVRLLLCALLCTPFLPTRAGAPGLSPGTVFASATPYQEAVTHDPGVLVAAQDGPGTRTGPAATDDARQILGNACADFGDCGAALLTPVPEPGLLVLLVTGLLAVGAGRYAVPRPLAFS